MNIRNTITTAMMLLACLLQANANETTRIKYSINEQWKFLANNPETAITEDINTWQDINLPHTWNNKDATDEVRGYHRQICWYQKNFYLSKEKAKSHTIIHFEGVNQIADVYVNGQFAGHHEGGYTMFNFDITPFLKYDDNNDIAVKVDNRHNKNIPPLSADFTFFGGIYRDVFLIHVNDVHFATNQMASGGVYVTTPKVNKEEASINIRAVLNNKGTNNAGVTVNYTIQDEQGKIIANSKQKAKVLASSDLELNFNNIIIETPQLWSPNHPYLYTVITQITDKNDQIIDSKATVLGLRWFEFSAEEGFFLNGEHLKLMGTNRHQDYLNMGNALPDEMHMADVKTLKAMGGNFLRIAHYPQDPTVLETCDRLGILATIEIPIVDRITENEQFSFNCINMAKEMVAQHFNHPSLIIWAYMNEVLLRPPFMKDKARHKIYCENVTQLAQEIENTIREADPYRATMIPNHGAFDRYNDAKLTEIPMVVGWNLYHGWYEGNFPDFDKFLDMHREKLPHKPAIVTEYGAGVHSRLHSYHPERFDYTVEYGNQYHEHYLKAILDRPFIAGANIWNLNDFYSTGRGNARPTVNCKGINGLDREPKDTYHLYKATLSKTPQLIIAQKAWKVRGGVAQADKEICAQPINVYSNAEEVELFHNHQSLGLKKVIDKKASWMVDFTNGNNKIEAKASTQNTELFDQVNINFKLIPFNLHSETLPFTDCNILLGSQRYYEDQKLNVIWVPEKEYTPGSWGYIGGEAYAEKTYYGSFHTSKHDIKQTTDDPVFQSQRMGLSGFKFDVPNGKYTLSLSWAELFSDIKHDKLAYNLGADDTETKATKRIFNVKFNGVYVEYQFDITKAYKAEHAITKKYEIIVTSDEGLEIEFEAVSALPVLNALRLYKNL